MLNKVLSEDLSENFAIQCAKEAESEIQDNKVVEEHDNVFSTSQN